MMFPINYTVPPGSPHSVAFRHATIVNSCSPNHHAVSPPIVHLREISTPVSDLRDLPPSPSSTLMHRGFEVLWKSPSSIAYDEFGTIIGSDDRFEVTDRYRAETCQLLRSHLGASRVVPWNHHIRRSGVKPSTEPDHPNTTLPASRAHVDQSERRGRESIMEELGFKTFADLTDWVRRGGRAAIVNVWRPLAGPVRMAPLCICDGRSVRSDELVTCTDYFGEHYSVGYHESQRWYYVSDQMPSEPILILCYDSNMDSDLNPQSKYENQRARCCPHTAAVPSDVRWDTKETRESIEVRTYVFWDPPHDPSLE